MAAGARKGRDRGWDRGWDQGGDRGGDRGGDWDGDQAGTRAGTGTRAGGAVGRHSSGRALRTGRELARDLGSRARDGRSQDILKDTSQGCW